MLHIVLLDPVSIIGQLVNFNFPAMEKEGDEPQGILFLVGQIFFQLTLIQCFRPDKIEFFYLDLLPFIDIKGNCHGIVTDRFGRHLYDRVIIAFCLQCLLHHFFCSLYTHLVIQVTLFDTCIFKKLFSVISIAVDYYFCNSLLFMKMVDQGTSLLLYPDIFKISLFKKVFHRIINLLGCYIFPRTDSRNFISNTF